MQIAADTQRMTINKLSPHIGAEVTGVDLTRPLDAESKRRLHAAVVDNICLVIRDQHFTPTQYLEAMKVFGEPMVQDSPQYAVPDVPLVRMISNRHVDKKGNRIKVGVKWHTDHTNHDVPPKFTILYAVELPSKGGGTSVVNMRAGYESLPADVKKRIDGMKTNNVRLGSGVKEKYNASSVEAQEELNPDPVVQPLVRTNPDNGTKALYFHANKTENIVGMSPDASQALLYELLDQAVKPELIYTHLYRPGDVFLWDNRSAMHMAGFDYDQSEHRLLYRCLIKGERPR
jgi:taurine dioxygenase